jgi:cellobiose-specific phosphotransferase system component IIB
MMELFLIIFTGVSTALVIVEVAKASKDKE